MKKLIKSCFILVITVSTLTCFADEAAELRELNHMILHPIIHNFSESGSYTKCTSLAIAKEQIQNQRQLTQAEYNKLRETLKADPALYDTLCKIKSNRDAAGCKAGGRRNISITGFAKSYLLMWQSHVANCGEYAELALIAFAFDWVNNEQMKQSQMFKGAVLVGSKHGTGDHIFLLVEGVSGTLFVVDPWLRSVLPLQKPFPALPEIIYGIERQPDPAIIKKIPIASIFGSKLSLLYRNKDSNYYDNVFVRENTAWELEVAYSKRIQSFAYHYDGDMKNFYNTLKHKFPGWVKDYDKLPLERTEQKPLPVDKLSKPPEQVGEIKTEH